MSIYENVRRAETIKCQLKWDTNDRRISETKSSQRATLTIAQKTHEMNEMVDGEFPLVAHKMIFQRERTSRPIFS